MRVPPWPPQPGVKVSIITHGLGIFPSEKVSRIFSDSSWRDLCIEFSASASITWLNFFCNVLLSVKGSLSMQVGCEDGSK